MKLKLLSILLLLLSNLVVGQQTYVPDDNFENYLETHDADGNTVSIGDASSMGNGIANDNYVIIANIENVTSLNVSNKGISNISGIEAFQSLQFLNVDGNSISTIDLSANLELLEFSAISNDLVNLSLIANTKLERVDVSDNDLITFDFRNGNNGIIKTFRAIANYQLFCITVDNIALSSLVLWNVDAHTSFDENCGVSTIPDDNFEAFLEANGMGNGVANDNYVYTVRIKEVISLDVSNQNIGSLEGIAAFQKLEVLNCAQNDITSLDISQNLSLKELTTESNPITSLDLTANTNLLKVDLDDNELTSLDFRNGNNALIQTFSARANYNLLCITVDDSSLSSLALWTVDSGTSFNEDCDWTYVPDDNFENYLETHDANGNTVSVGDASSMGNGIANDDYVTTNRIADVEELDIDNLGITDLTGIEGFTALKKLDCQDNTMTSLNLSYNLALEELNCYRMGLQSIDITKNVNLKIVQVFRNELTSIDISNNTALTRIDAFQNQLTSIDISHNIDLESISCARNQIASLDVSNNTKLKKLTCYDNNLTSLDVTNLPILEDLDCVENNLTSLDLSQNPELLELQVYENNLTSLDVSNNVKLIELYAESNSITSLDVSKNVALVDLSIAYNQLTYLNIKNGNNTNLDHRDFDIRNNPGLTCVSVDDTSYAETTFTRKDAQTEYKLFCTQTYVPDDNFEAYLETHNSVGGVVPVGDITSMGNGIANDDYVGTEQIKNILYLNISNQGITDFTGLEGFTALKTLQAYGNTVSSLDITANTNLTEITCSDMGLTSINLSNLTKLGRAWLGNNNLSTIDLSSNTNLNYLNVDRNNFTAIDISSNLMLSDFRIRENELTALNTSSNTNLTRLYCGDNALTTLDVSNNALLQTLSCGENQLTTIDVSTLVNLTDLFIEDTPTLTSLDVSQNVNLEDIGVNGNTSLTALDVSGLTKLIEVYTYGSQVSELDFSNSPDFEYGELQNGALTSLNLKNGNNSSDIELYATGNSNLLCIQVDDTSASYLNSWEKDATTSFSNDCNWSYIPDDRFEDYLETHDANNNNVAVGDPTSMGNGIANDNYVKTANIENVTDLFVGFQGITDLTGLEAFTSLQVLFIFNNVLTNTHLDLTANTNLKRIEASSMGLTSIDISNLTGLERVEISRNSLTSVNLATNTALKELIISTNNLTGLDVSNNILLEDLQIHETTLSSIDVSKNVNLTRIIGSLNQFTEIDLKNNPLLDYLNLAKNPFTSFDVSGLTNLEELNLDETNITSIDISKNTKLTEFSARNNSELVELNARNGNNSSFTDFEVDGCPNLTCIEVDDPTGAYLASWDKDVTASFAEYCRFTSIPDANFEAYLETHNEYGGTVALGSSNSLGNGIIDDNLVPTAKIENIQLLTPRNEGIEDFTGIEDFVSLIRLWIDDNSLTNTSLDLTKNKLLENITIGNTGLTSLDITGLTVLESLEASNNSLTTLDISTNVALKFLNLADNNLTSIDVTNNDLTSLTVTNNSVNTIDVSNQLNLVSLYCENTNITSLNIQNNVLLENLECGKNSLTSLDVTKQLDLFYLSFSNTSIAEIDLSNNLNLSRLICDSTSLTTLDLGNQNTLDNLSCKNASLTRLNLRSGNNADLDNVDVTGNPSLTCISVEDPAAAALLGTWLKDATANYAEYCRMTYVPDDNFEALLEGRGFGNGIANDDYVYTALIENETSLIIQDNDISDLTGIEGFKSIELLICRRSNLETIDISQNSKLTHLSLEDNKLTNIDISTNTELMQLITGGNPIGTLDISSLTKLETLQSNNNNLSTIDISNNPLLRSLNINDNNFTNLNISACSSILQLRIANNQLTSLNVANGNNTNFTWFDAQGNTGLNCIEVDDINPDSAIWHKDASANYALYCELTYIADANFENYLETHDADGNVVAVGNSSSMGNGIANDNQVATSKIEKVIALDISSQNISDVTGIEAFTLLESLNLDYNDLTALNLSSNSSLRILNVAENDLTELDLSVIPTLEEVELRSNKIRTLTVNNPNLKKLRASKNQYTYLDVTNCPQLEELGVTQTLLVSLDVRNGNNNLMADFNARFNDYLTCIEVDDASASYLSTWDKDVIANFSENCNSVVWSGNVDTNWQETNNWIGNAAPQTTSNVIIPNSVTTPIVESDITVEVNDLFVDFFTSFDVGEDGGVLVNEDFTNNGVVTIKSSTNKSGVLIVKGISNGQVTYERGGLVANKWSIISAPVSGQSIKDFVENPENNIRINPTVTPNRYAVGYYDDNRASGDKWVYYTTDDLASNSITFEKGKSYAISRGTDGAVSFIGTIETSDINQSIVAGQWNSIGNPYTAFLPMNENGGANFVNDNLANFDPMYVGAYVWDNSQSKYVPKTLVSAAAYVAPGQGFLVKVSSSASSISFKEAQRALQPVTGGAFSRGTEVPTIKLSLASKGTIVTTNISYRTNGTKGLDPGYDVGNFDGAGFDIYTRLVDGSSDNNFIYQSLPIEGNDANVIPVGIKAQEGTSIVVSLEGISLPEEAKVFFEDKELAKLIDLTKEDYQLTLSKGENGVGRFYLHTKIKTFIPEVTIDGIKLYNSNRMLFVDGIYNEKYELSLYNTLGSLIYQANFEGTGKDSIDLPIVETGVYIVKVKTAVGIKSKKIVLKK
ncbi:conserved protein of unknown function precursor containing a type A C-terminal secretion signal [Tenacibaculum sp. 190130A14a]|uniref:T9SS type A sorting domain-containing protein n=1 Tax=Tenacibaculum polynesiense TaxID=3137857 RepID=A0ABP1F3Z8_9FLAO